MRRCQFTFCSLCNAAYHPGRTCLSPEAQLEIVRARMQGTRQNEEELRRKEAEILNLAVIEVRFAGGAAVASWLSWLSRGCGHGVSSCLERIQRLLQRFYRHASSLCSQAQVCVSNWSLMAVSMRCRKQQSSVRHAGWPLNARRAVTR